MRHAGPLASNWPLNRCFSVLHTTHALVVGVEGERRDRGEIYIHIYSIGDKRYCTVDKEK